MTTEELDAIEARFVELAGEIPGIAQALDFEPLKLSKLPAIALLPGVEYQQDERYTGPIFEAVWSYRVTIYVALGDYRTAQKTLRNLVPALLAIGRDHRDLDGLCEKIDLVDRGGEPEFDHDGGMLWKTFTLRVYTEEPAADA